MHALVLLVTPSLVFSLAFNFGEGVLVITRFLFSYFCLSQNFLYYPLRWRIGRVRISRPGLVVYFTLLLASDIYLCNYKDFLDIERFAALPSNDDVKAIYDARNRFDGGTVLNPWPRRETHCGGHSSVMWSNDVW